MSIHINLILKIRNRIGWESFKLRKKYLLIANTHCRHWTTNERCLNRHQTAAVGWQYHLFCCEATISIRTPKLTNTMTYKQFLGIFYLKVYNLLFSIPTMCIFLPIILSGTRPSSRKTSVSPICTAAIPTKECSMLSKMVLSGEVMIWTMSIPFGLNAWWHLKKEHNL